MFILEALYFFLPAYIANMAPVFAAKLLGKRFELPIDNGKMFRGKRVFGDHKTWRGLISGILVAVIVVYLQKHALTIPFLNSISIVDYNSINLTLLGILFGAGALIGDAVKSFFKRQRNINSGGKWIGFDQLDFVIGGLLFVSFIYIPSMKYIITLLVISPLLHVLVNIIGYHFKLKKNPW